MTKSIKCKCVTKLAPPSHLIGIEDYVANYQAHHKDLVGGVEVD